MKGSFQTSREIFEHPIWNDIPKFRIFFFIVGNAVFSESGVPMGSVKVGRGQYLRSFRNLSNDLEYIENRSIKKYSLSLISRKVEQLVKEERLLVEDTELGTLFTVCNYALYQGFNNMKKNNENAERTATERSENGDGTATERRRNNNKNVNKVNNDKNELIKEYTSNPLLLESLNDFVKMRKANKGAFTDKALTLLLGKLDKLAKTDQQKIDILNQSIMSSWKGLFPIKQDNIQGKQNIKKDTLPSYISDQTKQDKIQKEETSEEEEARQKHIKEMMIELGEWDEDKN